MMNYHHLRYFWAVATEGSLSRAAEKLGVSVQTISGQISKFEESLGRTLFKQEGRKLVLTEAGQVARRYADPSTSYTASLFAKGPDAILKKIGEESAELIMAAKDGKRLHIVNEATDVVYHVLVLMAFFDMSAEDILQEMHRREGGNRRGVHERVVCPRLPKDALQRRGQAHQQGWPARRAG